MSILAILNPVSGNKDPQLMKKEFIKIMNSRNINYELYESQSPDDAFNRTKEAVNQGYKLIIAIGGDGTVNHIVNAIVRNDICLGIIPNGTGNLLATSLGIPMDIHKALDIILDGQPKKIDLGKINDQYFSIIAGCGFDADIMKNIQKSNKKLFGILAYFLEGFRLALFPKRSVFKLNIDGKTIKKRGLNVLFINTGNILGNFITIVPNASISDGLLDICIFSPSNTIDYIPVLWNILTKQSFENYTDDKKQSILHCKAKKVRVDSRPRRFVQADGDIIGKTPVDIEVIPDAITIMTPEKIDTFVMNPEECFKNIMVKIYKEINKIDFNT